MDKSLPGLDVTRSLGPGVFAPAARSLAGRGRWDRSYKI
jgi:hypothetical protein